MQKKVIVIVGQTATGKSTLAVRLARLIDGEVISAYSRQVYKDLDIGTGKISEKEMCGVQHHLLDVANPKKKFTVALYKKLADKKIAEILGRGKVPIICGGTGFYVDAVTNGVVLPEVPPNPKLRKILNKKTAAELFKILEKLDKRRAKNIDANNKVRLVRAIEIAKHLGKVPSLKQKTSEYKFIKIGLSLPIHTLEKKVKVRVKGMFKAGLLKEVDKLKKAGIYENRLKELGFEYYKPTEDRVTTETIKYAKRQMTWFKRDEEIKWFLPKEYSKIKRVVFDFVGKK